MSVPFTRLDGDGRFPSVATNLAVHDVVDQRRRAGLAVLPLAFGESGLPVHPALKYELAGAAGVNGYGSVSGDSDLREAAAGYWRRRGIAADSDLIVCGPGSKPLLFALLLALGGDVVLPRPSWVSYSVQAELAHLRPLWVATRSGEGGIPDPDELRTQVMLARRQGRDVRSVIVTIPDNPTGTLARPETVRSLCRAARDLDLTIISDEIYSDLVFAPETIFPSPSRYAPERTVITTGLSKNLALGGWRLGVALVPDPTLRQRLLGAASNIWTSPSGPIQRVAAYAFREPPEIIEHIAASRRLHAAVVQAMATRFTAAQVPAPVPQAAFYLYPDFEAFRGKIQAETSTDLAHMLMEEHGVAVVPGTAFGEPPQTLKVRVATSLLYGQTDMQREIALSSPNPTSLPWIATALDRTTEVLNDLIAASDDPEPTAV